MAALSDGITYLGGAAGITVLAAADRLNLYTSLCAMTAACALAVAVQATWRRPTVPNGVKPQSLVTLMREFWDFGRWAFFNGLTFILSVQIFPWSLAIVHGPAGAAEFQAVLNIANLVNPVVFGLSNIIMPQATQILEREGLRNAWNHTRKYIAIGFVLLASYVVFLMSVPLAALHLIYGANSAYVDLQQALRIAVMAVAISSVADMIYAFIGGVKAPRLALRMHIYGLLATAILLPFAAQYGVLGCTLLLVASRGFRLVASWLVVAQLISPTQEQPSARDLRTSSEGTR
jgi:O-antigen/teichoic acid export membrane protein